MSQTLLIDGDVLLYRMGFGNEQEVQWDTETSSEWEEPDLARAEIDNFIASLMEKTGTKENFVCLSGPSDCIFRYQILNSYKFNRKDKPKPRLFETLKEHLHANYTIRQKPNLEADDVMGILATKYPDKYVIASIDKDLEQIPGWMFNWDKQTSPKRISRKMADKFFYQQCLSGDPSDGYSGVPGIGPKKAARIIHELYAEGEPDIKVIWNTILETYKKKNLDESYALTMARVARILRYEDWNEKTQEPVLWLPFKNDYH